MSLGARAQGSHRARAALAGVIQERERCRLAVQASSYVEQRLAVVTAVDEWRWSKHEHSAVEARVDEVQLLWYFPASDATRRELGVVLRCGEDRRVVGPVRDLFELGRVLDEVGS